MPGHERLQQFSLFDELGSLNIQAPLKQALNDAAKLSKYSREEIVDRMQAVCRLYGVKLRVTTAVFEKLLNPNDEEHDIPSKAIPIFCKAVDCDASSIIQVFGIPFKCKVVSPEDSKILEYAKLLLKEKEISKRRKILEKTI